MNSPFHFGSISTFFLLSAALFIPMIGVAGCANTGSSETEVREGLTREEVLNALGDPAEVQEFRVPDEPFFGPQEILTSLVPAGATVVEWVYRMDGELTYIWFFGEAEQSRDSWTVVATATHPQDAVY